MTEKRYADTLEEMFNQSIAEQQSRAQQQAMQSQGDAGNFVISYPATLEDIKIIIDGLRSGCSALVNFNKVAKAALTQRMLDYLSGATYALGGAVRKVQEGQYLVTASGISIKVTQ